MKISLNWLQEYIDLSEYRAKLDDLSEILTNAGLEVEEMVDKAAVFNKVVIGEIKTLGKHPDADKLTLCQVDVGSGQDQQIICGAKNHKQGDKVIVATPGAVLPGNFAIKKSKIRGVESLGMLCSEKELGLSDESEGILIADADAPVGKDFSEVYGVNDVVFELNVTPNRADCLSHIGLARELSTLLNLPVKMPERLFTEGGGKTTDSVSVDLKDSELCPRYAGRVIKGVTVKESPLWLKQRLEAVGVNPINNIVDITNYVLFEYGQPLHAFDLKELKGSKIEISKAKKGEIFVSLDGTELSLTGEELLIRDGERPVALAGVVGGQNSGVNDSTRDLFLESAFFNAKGVRRSSRLHGIDTDSCYRFSRGVNPEQTVEAMNRATYLFAELAGGVPQQGHHDQHPNPIKKQAITITTKQVAQRLGYEVTAGEFKTWMERLGASVKESSGVFAVIPPASRWDIELKEDLIEEYARLNGYDKLQEVLPVLATEPTNHVASYSFQKNVRKILKSQKLNQAVNYAFYSANSRELIWGDTPNNKLGLSFSEKELGLQNPLSEELSKMRSTLLPGLWQNCIHNYRHGNVHGGLFEMGAAHIINSTEDYSEEGRLAICLWGNPKGLWSQKPSPVVYRLKGMVESLLSQLHGKKWVWNQLTEVPQGFHPGRSASLFFEGKLIGLMGEVHPSLCEDNKIKVPVAFAELNLDLLGVRQPRVAGFSEISKFPGTDRDISFVVSGSTTAEEFRKEIKRSAGPLLQSVEAADVFTGGDLEAGQRSVTFKLGYQSLKGTLSDDEVNATQEKVITAVCQKLGVRVR